MNAISRRSLIAIAVLGLVKGGASAAVPVVEWPLDQRISGNCAIVQVFVRDMVELPQISSSEITHFYRIEVQKVLFTGQKYPPWQIERGPALYGLNMAFLDADRAAKYRAFMGRKALLVLLNVESAVRDVDGRGLRVYRGGRNVNDAPISLNRLNDVSESARRAGLAAHDEGDRE